MRKAIFLVGSRKDFRDILSYISDIDGSAQAGEIFVRRLRKRCNDLAALPGTIGRPRPDLGVGIRSFPHKSYVIFFRYIEDRFEVINVLEGHRDLEAFFSHDKV